jgi:hypothetical protein
LGEPQKEREEMNDVNFNTLFQIVATLARLQGEETDANRHTNANRIGDAIDSLYGVKPTRGKSFDALTKGKSPG